MHSLSSWAYLGALFQDPGRSFFLRLCLFLKMAVQRMGRLKREARSTVFNQRNSCFGGLAVGKHYGRGNDSITVVITAKIGLCSKWLSVVRCCILRNKSS